MCALHAVKIHNNYTSHTNTLTDVTPQQSCQILVRTLFCKRHHAFCNSSVPFFSISHVIQ